MVKVSQTQNFHGFEITGCSALALHTHVCYRAQRIVTMLTITMSYNTKTLAHSCTADHVLSVPQLNMLPPLVSRFEFCPLYHEATVKLYNSENPHTT